MKVLLRTAAQRGRALGREEDQLAVAQWLKTKTSEREIAFAGAY
jgi:hypothetical protein